MLFRRCSRCQGFVPPLAKSCPNCSETCRGAGVLSRMGLAGGVLGGGAVAFTLMACYGMAPCADGTDSCYTHLPPGEDAGADAADGAVSVDAGPDAVSPDAGDGASTDGTAADAPGDSAADAQTDGGAGDAGDAGDAGAKDGAVDSSASDAAHDGGGD